MEFLQRVTFGDLGNKKKQRIRAKRGLGPEFHRRKKKPKRGLVTEWAGEVERENNSFHACQM